MSIWHTGNQANYPTHRSKMAPSSSDSVPVSAPLTTGSAHLDTIMNEYNRAHAENTAIFVKSIVQLLSSGATNDAKMLTFNPPSEPAVASTYREHRAKNEPTSDAGWSGGNGGDSWADSGSKSGGSEWGSSGDSRPSRGGFNGGRGGRGGGNSDGTRRPPREPRPGDWNCKACKASNFARNTHCFRRDCGVAKEDDSSAAATNDSFSDNSSKRPADSPVWDDAPTDAKKTKAEPEAAAPSKPAENDDDW